MRQLQRGFSLIELMIASTIGLIVVGSIGYFYLGTRQAYRTTDNLSRIQESHRIVLDTLAREIRLAGYVGCVNLSGKPPTVIAKPPAGSPSPYVVDGNTVAQIIKNPAVWAKPSSITILQVTGTDVLSIRYASNSGEPAKLTGNLTTVNANIQMSSNPGNFNANDVLMISDCSNTDIFRATTVSNGGTVTIAHAMSTNTDNKLSKKYGPDAEVLAFHDVTFFIGTNAAGNPALYRFDAAVTGAAAEEIAENVENMQLQYGLDTNTPTPRDGIVDSYATTIPAGAKVISIRLALVFTGAGVGSADTGLNTATSAQTYSLLGTSYTAPNTRLRKIGTATVLLRNQALF